MAGIVPLDRRGIGLNHLVHLDSGDTGAASDGFEYRLDGAIGAFGVARHGARIGHVRSRCIEADELRRHGPASNVENVHGSAHCYPSPFSARVIVLSRSRSEERRVGTEGVSKCRTRWVP